MGRDFARFAVGTARTVAGMGEMLTSQIRSVLSPQWLIRFGLVWMVSGYAWLPADREPMDFATLTRGLSDDITNIIEFQRIDNQFSVVTYTSHYNWNPYPSVGCVIGATIPIQGNGRVTSLDTIAYEETRDLPAQPLVVLQDYFYEHHVACIFLTEAGRALGGTTLELTDRHGEIEAWQFVQGHAVIVADGETPPDIAPFAEYRLLDRDGALIYITDYIDWSFYQGYYQQFGDGSTYPMIRTVTPLELDE